MKEWIIPLDSALPARLVGRKAAALGQLVKAGFPIPSSVCITTNAFSIAMKTMDELSMPVGLMEDLHKLFPVNTPLVVRSSARQEDRPEASLAGRYSTHLNVIGETALERAILDIWRSYIALLPDHDDGSMAILIQPLIDAECAGVCFTVGSCTAGAQKPAHGHRLGIGSRRGQWFHPYRYGSITPSGSAGRAGFHSEQTYCHPTRSNRRSPACRRIC